MRFALLVLLAGCVDASADTKPKPNVPPSGIVGDLLTFHTRGAVNGSESSGPLACKFEVTRDKTLFKVKTDDKGHFKQPLNPGTYTLSFTDCTQNCQDVRPKPPATIEVVAGEWKTIGFSCMFFSK